MILGNTQEFASPEEALVHFGVKGMKWGVRKEEVRGGGPNAHIRISNKTNRATVSGTNIAAVVGTAVVFIPAVPLMFLSRRYRAENAAATRQNRKVQGDKKFKKAIENSKKAARVHNMAAKEINAQLPAFNNDKRWKGMTPDSPKQKAYDAAVEKELLNPEYAKAAVKVYGSESPSGRYKFEIDSAEKGTLKFRDTLKEAHEERQKVEHADDDEELVEVAFDIVRNSTGHILGFKPDSKMTAMAQSAIKESVNILEHHGVKGMKWGVRNEEDTGGKDAARTNADAKREMVKEISTSSSGRVTSVPTPRLTPTTKPSKGSPEESASKDAKKQQRVDEFLKHADVMDTRISELKIRNKELQGSKSPAKVYEKYVNNQSAKEFEQSKKTALKDAEAVQHGKLTSKQKKVIFGALAVSGILATGVVYGSVVRGQQSGAFNSYRLLAEARLRGEKVPFHVNKELTGHMSAKDLLEKVAKPVNPGYAKAGGKMNCRRSTFAYELRRRGFDVHATTSAAGWGQSESGVINAITPGSRNFYRQMSMSQAVVTTGFSSVARGDTRVNPLKKILLDDLDASKPLGQYTGYISNSKRVLEELAKQPNGSRGEVLFKFPQFGHSMAYEVVDGVPHIFDSQKGTLYNEATKMVEHKWDGFTAAEITRLDNVDLDLDFLTRWSTNVGG